MAVIEAPIVAKKSSKPAVQPKRYGTLIRVSDDFAEAIKEAAGFRGQSISEFADAELLERIRKVYSDDVIAKAKKLQGGGK